MSEIIELSGGSDGSSDKIQSLLAKLYGAEAKVQMEAGEVTKYPQVASAAQLNSFR